MEVTLPFQITDTALTEIRRIRTQKGIPADYALRVGMKGGGCGGMSYLFAFDQPKETDRRFEVAGVPVVVARQHFMYLLGVHIDFEDGQHARGFTFEKIS